MMAKDPRDRYQTPEELVHHLLLTARTLGVNPDVPEGVLTLEAAIPASPVGRPLIWTAVAAIAIIALVLALNPLSNTNSPTRQGTFVSHKGDDGGQGVKDSAPPGKGNEKPPPVRPVETPEDYVYTSGSEPNVDHLVKWLEQRKGAARVELRLAGEYDLNGRDGSSVSNLLIQCKQLIIKPRDRDSRPTIRLGYRPDLNTVKWVALTVASQDSRIEGIRFLWTPVGAKIKWRRCACSGASISSSAVSSCSPRLTCNATTPVPNVPPPSSPRPPALAGKLASRTVPFSATARKRKSAARTLSSAVGRCR